MSVPKWFRNLTSYWNPDDDVVDLQHPVLNSHFVGVHFSMNFKPSDLERGSRLY